MAPFWVSRLSLWRREWYGYHFPELIKIVSDNYSYCRLAKLIGNRKELSEESLEALEEIVMDSAKAQAILDASRSSMGQWQGGDEKAGGGISLGKLFQGKPSFKEWSVIYTTMWLVSTS